MSSTAEFYVPDDDVLCELGRLQVRHSHLDHTLRLGIKRLLGISINDPGYWNETRGMSAGLRARARELIAERYSDDDNMAGTPEAALARSKDGDPRVAERFEVYLCGVELANGFGELNDATEQRRCVRRIYTQLRDTRPIQADERIRFCEIESAVLPRTHLRTNALAIHRTATRAVVGCRLFLAHKISVNRCRGRFADHTVHVWPWSPRGGSILTAESSG